MLPAELPVLRHPTRAILPALSCKTTRAKLPVQNYPYKTTRAKLPVQNYPYKTTRANQLVTTRWSCLTDYRDHVTSPPSLSALFYAVNTCRELAVWALLSFVFTLSALIWTALKWADTLTVWQILNVDHLSNIVNRYNELLAKPKSLNQGRLFTTIQHNWNKIDYWTNIRIVSCKNSEIIFIYCNRSTNPQIE